MYKISIVHYVVFYVRLLHISQKNKGVRKLRKFYRKAERNE